MLRRTKRTTPDGTAIEAGIQVFETSDRPGWKIVVLFDPLTQQTMGALTDQVISGAEHGLPDLVVDVRNLSSSSRLAGVLGRCAEVLHWAGGSLIVTGGSRRLCRCLGHDISGHHGYLVL